MHDVMSRTINKQAQSMRVCFWRDDDDLIRRPHHTITVLTQSDPISRRTHKQNTAEKIRLAQVTLFLRLAEYSSMGTQGEAPHRRRQSAFSAAQLCIRGSAVRWQRAAETGQRRHLPPHSAPLFSPVEPASNEKMLLFEVSAAACTLSNGSRPALFSPPRLVPSGCEWVVVGTVGEAARVFSECTGCAAG